MEYVHNPVWDLQDRLKIDNSIDMKTLLPVQVDTGCNFDYNSQIRFTLTGGDAYIVPSESFLYMEGRMVKDDGTPITKDAQGDYPNIVLGNNAPMYLFRDIKYTIDDVEIESFTNVGIATLMKGLITKSSAFSGLEKGWRTDDDRGYAESSNDGYMERGRFLLDMYASTDDDSVGTFSFRIPLDFIFNFCEDYKKVIYHHKHQIIFQRKSNDNMALMKPQASSTGKVNLTRMMWRVRKYTPSNEELENVYKYTKEDIMLYFRNKYIISGTVDAGSTSFPINISHYGGFGTPRYIVVGFQV